MITRPTPSHRAQTPPTRLAATLESFYVRHGVPHRVDSGRGGWVSTHCPFCHGSRDYHLGYSVERGSFSCWRCGSHPAGETLSRVLGVSLPEALDVYRSIRGGALIGAAIRRDREAQRRVGISRYRHPSDTGRLSASHAMYLARRGFDPEEVEREWGVLSTGPMSELDGIDYRHRVLVPIHWGGEEVSFQARDATGRSARKYISCPSDREVAHHKSIVYGRRERWGRTGIVVEGVTDVWRLGPLACATFGISFTTEQVLVIGRSFERVAIAFDPEPQAQAQARLLAAKLRALTGREPVVASIVGDDPGSMSQDDADHLVRELTR